MTCHLRHWLVCGIAFISVVASADTFNFGGYVKSYILVQGPIDITPHQSEFDSNYQSQNAVRLKGEWISPTAGSVQIHYELQPVYYSQPAFADSSGIFNATLSLGNNVYRVADLDTKAGGIGENTVFWQNLDRLNYRYSYKGGDVTIGRQVISFGSARFINPTDIFVPFNIQTLNQEYRVGIDAVRYQIELGDFALLDGGVIVGQDAEVQNSAVFVRGKDSIAGNDFEGMILALHDGWLFGGGLERAIGDVGFWAETAFMYVRIKDQDNYWRHSVGIDYAFNEEVVTMVEYHYNGAGSNSPSEYVDEISNFAYQRAGVFLLGRHYLIPSVSWTATPLLTFGTSLFWNLSDDSAFANVRLEQSWTDNLYSDYGLYLTEGKGGRVVATPEGISLGSEFGTVPTSFYASLRYYF